MTPDLIAQFLSTPWALAPERLSAFAGLIYRWGADIRATPEIMEQVRADAEKMAARREATAAQTGDGIAVIPVYGVISHRANMASSVSGSGGTSTEQLSSAIRTAVADPSVRGIMLDVDSPGGSVYGVNELAGTIYEARAKKPVFAYANALAASAAYWLGSQASEFHMTPSGEVGSIGVFAAHRDYSKAQEMAGVKTTLISAGPFKTEGNSYEPLSEEARAFMQSRIDDYYGQFVSAVARGRNVNAATVRDGYGGGRTLGASAAMAAGMVDGIGSFDSVLRRLAKAAKPQGMTRAAVERRRLQISG